MQVTGRERRKTKVTWRKVAKGSATKWVTSHSQLIWGVLVISSQVHRAVIHDLYRTMSHFQSVQC